MNLLTSSVWRVRTDKGHEQWATFGDLLEDAFAPSSDPIVSFAWPRADFDLASLEWAVALFAWCLPCANEEAWVYWRDHPKKALTRARRALADGKVLPHFDLSAGDRPLLQDTLPLRVRTVPIEHLLLDDPGKKGRAEQTDVLLTRDRYPCLGLPAAWWSVATLQAFASVGGRGYSPSIRGGGPLVVWGSRQGATLGQTIFLNMPLWLPQPKQTIEKHLFPPFEVEHVEGAKAHPLTPFMARPRRLHLLVEPETDLCSMTGLRGPVIRRVAQIPKGISYQGLTHPMTPYKSDGTSVKVNSTDVPFRLWTLATVGIDGQYGSVPAQSAVQARQRGADVIHLAGWNMQKSTAAGFLYAEAPAHTHLGVDPLRSVHEAVQLGAGLVRWAVRRVVPHAVATAVDDYHAFVTPRLHRLLASSAGYDRSLARQVCDQIAQAAQTVLDRATTVHEGLVSQAVTLYKAKQFMSYQLQGHTEAGQALYDVLGLDVPPTKEKDDA